MAAFFQAGLVRGMLQGVYQGDVDFKTLASHGDIGLGTFNGVDGEMIALDGKFYRADQDGNVSLVAPTMLTPFSVVAKASPSIVFSTQAVTSLKALNALIDKHLPTPNIFYLIRVDADFEWISLRSEACLAGAIGPLAEMLPKLQKKFELTQVQGSLVAAYCPAYSSGVSIPGYHYHFIDRARSKGGHAFDARISKAQIMITALREFRLHLSANQAFDTADLNMDSADALSKTE